MSAHRPQARVSLDPDLLPVVLVGLPGVGKTTVARLLAAALGVQVTDTDAEIRRRARMTVPEIFAAEGEEGFRGREHRALRAVLDSPSGAQGVVSLGGGAVLRPENRELLSGRTVVHLACTPATAAAHVGAGAGRPLMAGAEDLSSMLERMEALAVERGPHYASVASITVPTDGLSAQQVAAAVLVALGVRSPDAARAVRPGEGTHRHEPAVGPAAAPAGSHHSTAPTPTPTPTPTKVLTTPTGEARAGEPGGPAAPHERDGVRAVVRVGGPAPYEVLIGQDLEGQVTASVLATHGHGAGGVAVVHPAVLGGAAARLTHALTAAGLRVTQVPVPDGEECKTSAVLEGVWDAFGTFRMGRDGVVVGLGGGATTDLAGFAAATWLRGVPVVQVPTTLLAMVDASVGGKTGIDTPVGKNLVGAFLPPAAVVEDLTTLATLPREELRAGLGEVVKCGFIADPTILDLVLADPADCLVPGSAVLAELVERSVAVKARVVSQDLTESGLREILNYGHTYAHAIEKVTGFAWRHGEAVAVGCVFAAEVAHRLGQIDAGTLALHREAFGAVGLPVSFPEGASGWTHLHAAMLSDKKVRAGVLRMVLLEQGVPDDASGEVAGTLLRPRTVRDPHPDVLRAAHAAVTGGTEEDV